MDLRMLSHHAEYTELCEWLMNRLEVKKSVAVVDKLFSFGVLAATGECLESERRTYGTDIFVGLNTLAEIGRLLGPGLARESSIDWVETLCHEFVHVKQMDEGRLRVLDALTKPGEVPRVLWERREWDLLQPDVGAAMHDRYQAQPWEVEARQVGAELAEEWRSRG